MKFSRREEERGIDLKRLHGGESGSQSLQWMRSLRTLEKKEEKEKEAWRIQVKQGRVKEDIANISFRILTRDI